MKTKLLCFCIGFFVLFSCKTTSEPDDTDNPPLIVDTLGVSITNITFTSQKDASLVIVRTKDAWTVSKNADWLSISTTTGKGDTGFIIGAAENMQFPREATIIITAGNKTKQIKITQSGASTIELLVKSIPLTLIKVEGGQFTMGKGEGLSDGIAHKVTLNDFYISETEVTNELWHALLANLPYDFIAEFNAHEQLSKPFQPVSATTWNEIGTRFIPAINQATAKTFRLPTEAEWEYAALGGKYAMAYKYAGSNILNDVGWYYRNSTNEKKNVKEKLPNKLGIYDMSGNVNEYCSDWYDAYYGIKIENGTLTIPENITNPTGAETGTKKVVRGGSFMSDELWGYSECDVKTRNSITPSGDDYGLSNDASGSPRYFSRYTGFRLVISF